MPFATNSGVRIQEAIDAIPRATAAAPIADTVDTAKTGDAARPLTDDPLRTI